MDLDLTFGWRRVAVTLAGPEDGYPVFLLHGTPGSRLGPRPADDELAEIGVRLITYDRPGYGRSDAYRDRSVAQAADDVRAVADALGLAEFGVVGRSGGGPHALACAALLPDRVRRVASLVGLAPYDAEDLDWLAGMTEGNRRQYLAAVAGRPQLLRLLFPEVMALRSDPDRFVRRLFADAASSDLDVLRDVRYNEPWRVGMVEAVRRSLEGWAADNLAFTRPWGFDPAHIRVPTVLWHGLRDVFSPVAHTRWLGERIGDATMLLSERGSHLHAHTVQFHAMRWIARGGSVGRLAV